MSLHLVYSAGGWRACQARLGANDSVVLMGDGTYVATTDNSAGLNVLEQDAHIRGIRVDPAHTCISYDQLVVLCTQHHPIVSWND